MIISDDQLSNWTNPPFEKEEDMAERVRLTVKNAINQHPILKDLSIRVFAKGSYANNTNVRRNSDIDIAVEYEGLINLKYRDGVTFSDTGLSIYKGISEYDFKNYLSNVLVSEFGNNLVDRSGNKVFKIRGSSKILDADIIPCTTFRFYNTRDSNDYWQGIQLILDIPDGKVHYNYPDQHHENGMSKNTETKLRYKNVVRILKNLNNFMADTMDKPKCHSFMIECLAHNVPTNTYLRETPWRNLLSQICLEAWTYLNNIEPIEESERWLEVNKIKFLFHDDQKWTRDEAKQFIIDVYNLIKQP